MHGHMASSDVCVCGAPRAWGGAKPGEAFNLTWTKNWADLKSDAMLNLNSLKIQGVQYMTLMSYNDMSSERDTKYL